MLKFQTVHYSHQNVIIGGFPKLSLYFFWFLSLLKFIIFWVLTTIKVHRICIWILVRLPLFYFKLLLEVRINSNQSLDFTVIGHLIHGSLCNQWIYLSTSFSYNFPYRFCTVLASFFTLTPSKHEFKTNPLVAHTMHIWR